MKVKARLQITFLDSPKVLRAVGAARQRALIRAAGRIRRTAIYSIKSRLDGTSPPGQPPYSHVGVRRRRENRRRLAAGLPALARRVGIKLILFAWQPGPRSVVVGPVGFGRDTLRVLEQGGTQTIEVPKNRGRDIERKTASYAPRPYMGPALAQIGPTVPKEFRGTIRG